MATEREAQIAEVPPNVPDPDPKYIMRDPDKLASAAQLVALNRMGMIRIEEPGTMEPVKGQPTSWFLEWGKLLGYYDGEAEKLSARPGRR